MIKECRRLTAWRFGGSACIPSGNLGPDLDFSHWLQKEALFRFPFVQVFVLANFVRLDFYLKEFIISTYV